MRKNLLMIFFVITEILYFENSSYCCQTCNKSFTAKIGLHIRLRRVHKLNILSPQAIRYPHLQPDIDDPNFYCFGCDKTLGSYSIFYSNLKNIHNMTDIPRKRQILPYPHLTPDIDDRTNLYCKACAKTLANRHTYISHLKLIHKMNVMYSQEIVKPELMPDIDDPNFYCRACKKTFSSRRFYHCHLVSTHKLQVPVSKKAIYYILISSPNSTTQVFTAMLAKRNCWIRIRIGGI
jgi:hypothetical protein